MSPELADCIKAMVDARVPKNFLYDPSGAEISWLNPALAGWLASLNNRHYQLQTWL
jgi:dynein heavy chain